MRLKSLMVEPHQEFEIYGTEKMVLHDFKTKLGIAKAERTGGHTWTVTAAGMEPVSTPSRNEAIDAMNDMSLAIGRASDPDLTGYAVREPNYSVNGELVNIRDLP